MVRNGAARLLTMRDGVTLARKIVRPELASDLIQHRIDHAGGAAELRERTGIPVTGPHRADSILLDHLEQQGSAYGLDGARNLVPDTWLDEGERRDLRRSFEDTISHLVAPG